MQHAEQVRQGKIILDFMQRKTTAMVDAVYRNPVDDYICRDQAARERQHLFRHYPINLGLSCRLPKPGDYFTDDFTGV